MTQKTVDNLGYQHYFVARIIRLFEQEPGEPFASARLGAYVHRWVRWVRAGVTFGRNLRQNLLLLPTGTSPGALASYCFCGPGPLGAGGV